MAGNHKEDWSRNYNTDLTGRLLSRADVAMDNSRSYELPR